MKIIGWRAWFVGGRKFDSAHTTWEALPDDGAILILLYHDERARNRLPKRRTMVGCDYYFKQGEIYGHGDHPLKDVIQRYPGAQIKRGKWTTDEEYTNIINEASKDRFPPT